MYISHANSIKFHKVLLTERLILARLETTNTSFFYFMWHFVCDLLMNLWKTDEHKALQHGSGPYGTRRITKVAGQRNDGLSFLYTGNTTDNVEWKTNFYKQKKPI